MVSSKTGRTRPSFAAVRMVDGSTPNSFVYVVRLARCDALARGLGALYGVCPFHFPMRLVGVHAPHDIVGCTSSQRLQRVNRATARNQPNSPTTAIGAVPW